MLYAGKVTAGLASHRPCVIVVSAPHGLGKRGEYSTNASLESGRLYFTLWFQYRTVSVLHRELLVVYAL